MSKRSLLVVLLLIALADCVTSIGINVVTKQEVAEARAETAKAKAQLEKQNASDVKNKSSTPKGIGLSAGGIAIFQNGQQRRFKALKGVRKQLIGSGTIMQFEDFLVAYGYRRSLSQPDDKSTDETVIPLNQVSILAVEAVRKEDFDAFVAKREEHNAKRQFFAYVDPVGTYPPFISVTLASGKSERFRAEGVVVGVEWENGAGIEVLVAM